MKKYTTLLACLMLASLVTGAFAQVPLRTDRSGAVSLRQAYRETAVTTQLTKTDGTLFVDASSAAVIVYLDSKMEQGQIFDIAKTDATTNTVTVQDGGGTNVAVLNAQNQWATLQRGLSVNDWKARVTTNAPGLIHSNDNPALSAADGVNTTPSATETYITRILIPTRMTLTGVKLFNGSDVTGNVRIGLATSAGVPISGALTASTAGSGVDAYQTIPFAAAYVAEAGYYLVCIQYSSATARFNAHAWGTDFSVVQTGSTYGTMPTISPVPTAFVAAAANIFSLY